MKNGLCKNTANLKDIEIHFNSLNQDFIKELELRICLDDYFSKIIQHATLYEFWQDDRLTGFAAVYENRGINQPAYLTNISIVESQGGKGIGSELLQFVISGLKEKEFMEFDLEVKKNNDVALGLYKKFGFVVDGESGDSWLMKLTL